MANLIYVCLWLWGLQVNLGGSIHALEPLVYAFAPNQALLINDPAVCMDALWLPYRRDNQLLQRILKSTPRDVTMVFCHADVRGAYMNDGIRSKEGLEVDSFPKNMPIFSGHFHKPHTVCLYGYHTI
ncbi:hypothetical protein EON65_20985 [archaeon]|nr:MAG: hypothetical protein EON65_20985 [archaeon]